MNSFENLQVLTAINVITEVHLSYFSLYCLIVSLVVRRTCRNSNSDWNHYFLQDPETANEAVSIILAESPLSTPESSVSLEQPPTSVRNMTEDCNQPRTSNCFVLTAVQTEVRTKTPEYMSQAAPSPLRTFLSHRGGERSEQNQDTSMAEIKHTSPEEQNEIVMEVNEGSVQQRQEGTRKLQLPDALRQDRVVNDKIQRSAYLEDYLQPVNNNKLEGAIKSTDNSRLCPGEAQTLNWRPQPKPRMTTTDKSFPFKHSTFTGTLSNLQFTDMLKTNPLNGREALQQFVRVNPPDQSRHAKQHGYQNEKSTATPHKNSLRPANSVETPYTRVLSNTNWEVPSDHLSLFEKIGGGSFGQVWKGAVLDMAGVQGWSIVAVKMLKGKQESLIYRIIAIVKMMLYIMVNIIPCISDISFAENSSHSDLRDLLSELDLLKKLKPHPNVIQLKGCLTKDAIRCKGKRDLSK